jgi:hypothetical protein
MEPLELVDSLARRARGAPPVATGVRGAVLAKVRNRKRAWPLTPLWVFAGWLAPVAAAAVVFLVVSWGSLGPLLAEEAAEGPFDEVIAPLGEVMP